MIKLHPSREIEATFITHHSFIEQKVGLVWIEIRTKPTGSV